ncbi:MAG: glycosyltransferase family 4 protein [Patescibacteria group bacterium]
MNIAIIIRRLNVKGGAQRQALSLARELKNMGHNVVLYTFFYDKEKCFDDLLDGMAVFASNLADPKRLSELIDPNTDVLNPHDQEAYKVAYFFKKGVKNIPSIWMMNDVPSKDFGFWKESQFNPLLRRSFAKAVYHKIYDFLDSRFIKAQEKITVLDDWNKRLVREHFGKNAVVTRSGLDIDKFKFNEHKTGGSKGVKLLTTGIFFPHRRFEDLIIAVSLIPQAELTIVGDTSNDKKYYEKLKNLEGSLGVADRIRFLGKVSDQELVEAYKSHDIFVFPNHLQTWGLAVFEAMACGIPVILSRTTGASEVVTDRKNSMLINPKTPEEIKKAVIELASNPDFYSSISRNARKFVEENISWKRYAKSMLEVFNSARY